MLFHYMEKALLCVCYFYTDKSFVFIDILYDFFVVFTVKGIFNSIKFVDVTLQVIVPIVVYLFTSIIVSLYLNLLPSTDILFNIFSH